MTLLFRAKSPDALKARMDGFLNNAAKAHPDAKRTTGKYGAVEYVHLETPDRALCVYSAYPAADLHVRSNSQVALERVLAAVAGKDAGGKARFLLFAQAIAQGEELCAVRRVGRGESLPGRQPANEATSNVRCARHRELVVEGEGAAKVRLQRREDQDLRDGGDEDAAGDVGNANGRNGSIDDFHEGRQNDCHGDQPWIDARFPRLRLRRCCCHEGFRLTDCAVAVLE